MAGIGFELRRLLFFEPSMFAKARAYASAGVISSGPWIMTALTLGLVSLIGGIAPATGAVETFRALVTFAFAFSLITVGTIQMAVTRRVADLLYDHDYGRVLPAFVSTFLLVAIVQTVVGGGYSMLCGFEVATAVLFTALYAVIGLTWLALIFSTVIHAYNQIFVSYLAGTVVSVFLVWSCGDSGGLNAYLGSYTAGQSLTLMLLVRLLARGMDATGACSWDVLTSVRRYPALVATGLAYSLAIWIDKVVFWLGDGVVARSGVCFHPLYDTCSFLAYATVIPALAINLIHLETSFYGTYRRYYAAILAHRPLSVIEERRVAMIRSLRASVGRLLRTQGAVSVAVIVFAPVILEALGLPQAAVRLFRLVCLGALFHVLLLVTILVQLYFDLRLCALASALVFLVTNGGLAAWSLSAGFHSYGLGYVGAALVSLVVAFVLLERSMRWLHYETFTGQLRRRP